MHGFKLFYLFILLSPVALAGNPVAEAYSSFVRNMAHTITSDYQAMMNTNLETKQIEYNGYQVSFQYLLWRLRPNSVCANYRYDLLEYSQCSKAAQQLFSQTCQHLNNNPSNNWKHEKLTLLYCSAAVDYQPVIAEVGISKNQNDSDIEQRQRCSALRMDAMRTKDPHTIQMRDQVCNGGKN